MHNGYLMHIEIYVGNEVSRKKGRAGGKRDREKRQFCQYAESATRACANPSPPFKSDP